MGYWTLNGFLMVLVIQNCISKGASTPIQSPTEVSNQDVQTFPQEPELPAAETVPIVSPPSLKDVQQAVQEASEQVEGRGAEEVLKELLERVVEAALGQAEGGSEAKDALTVQEVVEDALGVQTEESNAGAEGDILEQPVEDENIDLEEGYTGSIEKQEVVAVDVFEDEAAEGIEVVQAESETAASLEKSPEEVETGVGKVEGLDVIDESIGAEINQEDVMEASEETDGDLEAGEAEDEDSREQVVLSVEKNSTETKIEDAEETPVVVEEVVGGEPEKETSNESELSLGVVDEKQIGNDWEKEVTLGEETQVDEIEGETTVLPSNDFDMKTTQSVVGEPVEHEEGVRTEEDAEGHTEGEHGHLVEGGTEEEDEEEGTDLVGAAEDERGDDEIKEESVALVDDEDEGKTGQDALEDSQDSDEETQEILVISGPQPEGGIESSVEQSPEKKPATPEPSLEEPESQENTFGHDNSNYGDKLIIPHQSTLNDFENDVVAEHPQPEGDEQGEADELVKDIPGIKETNEPDLEPWKIGAILAAVFLVLETTVIIIYILKCRNQKSSPALQRACEEGCVEPEAATGGDCSDDTLPAGNGDSEQTRMLKPSDVVSTLAKQKEQQQDELVVAMSDLSPSSTQELASTGLEPDPSQDLRTSI